MNQLAYFVLNVMFVTLPLLLLQTFSRKSPFKHSASHQIALYMGLAAIGCIGFPLTADSGYRLDLSSIPLIAGTLYGGLSAGIVLSLIAAVAREFMPGEDMVSTLAAFLAVACAAAAIRRRFFASGLPRKLEWGAALSLLAVGATYLMDWLLGVQADGRTAAWYAAVHTILLLAALAFNEYIRASASATMENVRMEKLNANSSLAVIIAHELRNPLTTVNGFLQLMKRLQPSEQMMYYLNKAMQELNEAEKVIHTYLTITKMREAEKTVVSVSNCIDAALTEIWKTIEQKKIDLVNAVSEDATLHCNEAQLQQCLLHLLRNGANALHRGGKLTVSSYWRGSDLAIVVSDNGVGMTEEQLQELGMPKYDTRSTGTGTGLMYCYHFVHSMEGKLRIQSQPGRGTTVTVTLPKGTI